MQCLNQADRRRGSELMQADSRNAPVEFDRGSSYRALVLESVLRALGSEFPGGVDRALSSYLREIRLALETGSVQDAVRLADRAWRTVPNASITLAPIFGRITALESRDDDAALRLLLQVEFPDADVAALIALEFARLRRSDDARRHLDIALKERCLVPGGLLARAASAIVSGPEWRASGWLGLGPDLQFIGELPAAEMADSLQIKLGDTRLTHPVRMENSDGRTLFSFAAPKAACGAILNVTSRGAALLGSGRSLPLAFGLDGRARAENNRISGWARIGWQPAEPLQLCFEDEHGCEYRSKTLSIARPGFRWQFRVGSRGAGLRGSRIRITALLPDGRWHPLPDTPLLLPGALVGKAIKSVRLPHWRKANSLPRRGRFSASQRATQIDVVIPVYRGRHESLACVDTVLATIGERGRVIVIDDATDDSALAAALDHLAADGRITLMRNEQNLGFVRTVNRALSLESNHDIVLLNSDTQVFDDWLQRLSDAAYAGSRVGTVTPLSNDGSIASYPRRVGAPIDAEEAAALHKLAAWTHSGTSIEVPVGVGFCLYLRRDCLTDVGVFDAAVFGQGYGEEADFCLRARQRGWSHRIAADVFVYHASGRSFGSRRAALLDRSQRLLNLLYPGYDRYIAEFLAQDTLHFVRRRLDERRLTSFEGQFVLLVTLALEGGVERFVAERGRHARKQGLCPLVLRPHKAGHSRRCELWTDVIDVPNLVYDIPADLSELASLLGRLQIGAIEVQHFLDLDPRVINMVRALNIPYDVVVHDYSWICPRVTLIDGSGRYCGEPAVSACESCVQNNGSRLGESISVSALRARSADWLGEARRVLAPSIDTSRRLGRYFPNLKIEVRPHADPVALPPRSPRSSPGSRVRVGLIGAIGGHKGYEVLLECAQDAVHRGLPLEFVVIGYTEDDKPLLKTGKVFVTGRYAEIEVPHLLQRERPDIVFLPSVWPETWCYTLDYALGAGLTVVAFDLGAIAERLRAAGCGLLLPLDSNARQINESILTCIADERRNSGVKEPIAWQPPQINARPYVQMPHLVRLDEVSISKKWGPIMIEPSASEFLQDAALSASVQVLPLPPGLYLFSVKAAAPPDDRTSGKLQLPAMHVGPGPGVRSEQVEFLAGPTIDGAWMFTQGDVLVAKVNDSGATLILTSVRSASGDVLSIEVERLEVRSQVTAATPAEDAGLPMRLPAAVAAANALKSKPGSSPSAESLSVPLQIRTHIRSRGDMDFVEAPWAGRVAPGLWIESFSVLPIKQLDPQDLEYKGLTGTGFETPWLSDDENCGTKGMSVPLVGFAIRLKPGPTASSYDCEYSGYYQSGITVGPLRNGAPCRSTVANDPLEGIQIRIVKKSKAAAATPSRPNVFSNSEPQRSGAMAPSFGRYREGNLVVGNNIPGQVQAAKLAKRAKELDNAVKSDRAVRPPPRSQNRIP